MKKVLSILFVIVCCLFVALIAYGYHIKEDTSLTITTRPTEKIFENTTVATEPEFNTTSEPVITVAIEPEPVFYLNDYERLVVECIVMGESGGEPYEGQLLVAFCILNGCIKEGVQPSELRSLYKYSGWNENLSTDVKNAVTSIFDEGYKPVDDTPLYFYAPKWTTSNWHESQRYICTVGGHKFFGEW